MKRKSREIPMLYSTDMVRAILYTWKSQTRRLRNLEKINEHPDDWNFTGIFDGCYVFEKSWMAKFFIKCPYGQPGDRMWVRESFLYAYGEYFYKADYADGCNDVVFQDWDSTTYSIPAIWKPSIHMPKKAARIYKQIKSIRLERLQSINEHDAISEGIEPNPVELLLGVPKQDIAYRNYSVEGLKYTSAIESYRTLWEKINGIESWAHNPWVWVVKFQPVK